jgi:hypothetical protein
VNRQQEAALEVGAVVSFLDRSNAFLQQEQEKLLGSL